jgi:anti-anti-sigma factor
MSERLRPAGTDLAHSSVDAGAPVTRTRTSLGVAGVVTGPSGTALLSVTLRTEPPEDGAAEVRLVAAAAGEVDLDTAPLLQAALLDAVDRHPVVCCDLSDVTFLSAAGLTALLTAYQRAQETGSRLTVRGAHGITRRVLQVAGVEQLLAGH